MAADVGRLLDFVTTWISFFESPLPFCVKKKTSSDRNKMLSRQERVFFQNLSKSDPQYALDFKRAIYKTYYQYKPETMTHIQNNLNRYDLPDRFSECKFATETKRKRRTQFRQKSTRISSGKRETACLRRWQWQEVLPSTSSLWRARIFGQFGLPA